MVFGGGMTGIQQSYLSRKLSFTEWNKAFTLWQNGDDTLMIARQLEVNESVIANGLPRVRNAKKGIAV